MFFHLLRLLPPVRVAKYLFSRGGGGIVPSFELGFRDGFNTGGSFGPTVGLVAQAGSDYMFNRNWGVFLDVKKLFNWSTGKSTGFDLGPPIGTIPGAATIKTTFQPWLFSTGSSARHQNHVPSRFAFHCRWSTVGPCGLLSDGRMPDYYARLIPDLEGLHRVLALRKQHAGLYDGLFVRDAGKFLSGYDMAASQKIAPHVELPIWSPGGGRDTVARLPPLVTLRNILRGASGAGAPGAASWSGSVRTLALPDVLMALAGCERRTDFSRPCGARFTDLVSDCSRR